MRKRTRRRLFLESLEPRYTLNADVNASGSVNSLDALIVVNAIHGYVDGYASEALDVNRDSHVNVGDAEAVIDAIFAARFGELSIGEGEDNNPPFAGDDSFYVQHDTQLTDTVSSNDWDMDGNPLSFSLVSGTGNGTLNFSGGSFTYVPNALFAGTDSFTYSVSDGTASDSATVTIYVYNNAPFAGDDTFYVQHDTTLNDTVSSNDWDMEGDSLTFSSVSGPSNGTLTFNSNGSFTYVPNALFAGSDTFMYSVTDGLESTDGSVMIYVTNTAPYVGTDQFYMIHDGELADTVSSNDWDMEGDALTFSLVSGPLEGTIAFGGNGSFQYFPDSLFVGTDMFVYRVSDGLVAVEGTAVIYVTNTVPMAIGDAYTTPTSGMRKLIVAAPGVLANDTDSDPGDQARLESALVSYPEHGTVTLNANGSFTYEPAPGYFGNDSFTYKVTDTIDDSEPATVSINVPKPVVSLSMIQGTNPAKEKKEADNDTDTSFVVSLPGGPVNFDITVPFTLAGQDPVQMGYATNGVDFSLDHSGSVTIPAGSPNATINLVILQDKFVEGSEHIAMTLQYPAGDASFVLENHFASTDIQDNDYWKWDAKDEVPNIPSAQLDPYYGDVFWFDSQFATYFALSANDNAVYGNLESYWDWWDFTFGGIGTQGHHDELDRLLKIEFDFDDMSGNIRPRDGSGLEGGTEVNNAFNDIAFSYAIDNSAQLVKTATVTLTALSGVKVNYTASASGGVDAGGKIGVPGGEISLGGSWNVSYSVTGTDGGIAMNHQEIYVFTLRSVEDPDNP